MQIRLPAERLLAAPILHSPKRRTGGLIHDVIGDPASHAPGADRVAVPGPDEMAGRKGRAVSDMFGKSNEIYGHNRERFARRERRIERNGLMRHTTKLAAAALCAIAAVPLTARAQ